MKTYRDQMHGLQFTPEQKAAMVDALLAASQAPHQRRPQPRKALLFAAVAAAVILCVACASGALQATVAAFSALFGISSPAQTQVIQDRAQVIQTSDTDNGVTVSMESVMGDAHNAQILFSIRRTDGQPLPSGGMSLTLRNLCSYGPVSGKDEKGSIPLVEGTWDLSFHLEYDTSTLSLPTGQTFHHGPLTGTVEEIRLSPISIYLSFRYTFEEETLAAGYDPGATELSKEAWLEEQKREWFSNLPLYVTFPDGTTQDIQQDTVDLGGFSQGSVYTLSGALQTVLPLDSIASFHLGDLTIPLPD